MQVGANRISLSEPICVNFHDRINYFTDIYLRVHMGSVKLIYRTLSENDAKTKFSFRLRNSKLNIT